MVNTDSTFRIGKGHTVCEDYALHFSNGAIVSDGCSSSKDTDFGSRIISVLARDEVENAPIINVDVFGSVMSKIEKISSVLNIGLQAFDATLLIAVYLKELQQVVVILSGDGCVIYKERNKAVQFYQFYYENNYPRYLTYKLNKDREGSYLEKEKYQKRFSSESLIHQKMINDYKILPFSDLELEYLLMTSDGIETFRNTKTNELIPIADVVSELTDFKQTKGEFIKRRVNKMIKTYEKQGVFHYDDFSVAGIYLN